MILSNRNRLRAIILGGCLFFAVIFGLIVFSPQQTGTAEKAVRESWRLMQLAGQYDFSTTVEQVTFPAPALANVGQSSSKEIYQIGGHSDLDKDTLNVRLFKNQASLLNQSDGLEIHIADGKASGRVIGTTAWEPIENYSAASFSFGSTDSLYLSAATNIREESGKTANLPAQDGSGITTISVTHYSFDVDSNEFAVLMRDQMVRELQRSGKLPLGMNLSVSDQYRQMVASGELWVNPEGLPVRMTIYMKMPAEKNGDRVEATISTDYFNHHSDKLIAAQSLPMQIASILGLPVSSKALGELSMQIGILACSALLLILMVLHSDKKFIYGGVAILVIISMLVSPVWQSKKAAVLANDFQAQNAAIEADREQARLEKQAYEAAAASNWDAHSNPLDRTKNSPLPSQAPSKDLLFNGIAAAQTAVETDGDEIDSDGDGLTDQYENQFGIAILDPHKADTDGDGLDDNIELLLNLYPGEADSDSDGIWDNDEVRPFYASDQDWYLNPEERDTDMDGQPDGAECPERLAAPVGLGNAGICHDTDGDGIPDAFDPDDDNDGIPTIYDESPYMLSSQTYSHSNPFKLSVSGLGSYPVFINYQIIPTNQKHLTYAMNVLDWPSGDTDGQIQRISDTVFSKNLTAEQATQDPRSQFGDMRLVPMLEIKFTGDSHPFPLSRTVTVEVNASGATPYTGKFDFFSIEGESGKTHIKAATGTTLPQQSIHLGWGECDELTRIQDLNFPGAGGSITINRPLGELLNGDYVLYLKENGTLSACAPLPVIAHGKMADYVVDSSILQAYGGSARNDEDSNILIYVPLSVVYDETGGHPVAFSSKVPYTNIYNGFSNSQQEVRVVWLINMLTDECKPIESGYDESASGTWCDAAIPDRWNKDISRIIHTYTDEFWLAGLSVVEDRGVEMAVIFENPATDDEPDYDDPLWGIASGLERSFLVGRSADGTSLDMTVDEIQRRFDPEYNNAVSEEERWSFERDSFRVVRYGYDSTDGVVSFISNGVIDLFDNYFNSQANPPDIATLLFARETTQRATSLGEPASNCSASGCSVDFGALDVFTQALFNWAPYQHNGDEWQPYAINDYLDHLEARLRSLNDYKPEDDSTDARNYADGQIALAKIYYRSLYSGVAALVAINGTPLINRPQIIDDWNIFNDFKANYSKGKIVAIVIKTAASMIIDSLYKNPVLMSAVLQGYKHTTEGVSALIKALGKGISEKVSMITKLLSNTLRKIAFGAAVFVAVAGLAVLTILYLVGDNTSTGKWAGRILFGVFGLISFALAGMALVNAIKAIKSVAESAKSAAIIGAIIAGIITWGVFIYTWITSGVSFGSIAFNNILAEAIAATVTIVLMAALACTGIGAIIVAIVSLIDALISTICALAGANEQAEDHWARQYVCIGISGWLTKIIKWTVYSNTYLIDYANTERLSFNKVNQDLQNVSAGITYGNHMAINIGVKNTITKSSVPIDWKAAAYFWQYSDSNAKSSTFSYALQPAEGDIHENLNRDDISGGWESLGGSKWEQEFSASTNGYSIAVPQPGINQDPVVYISEGSAIPVQECWAIYIPFPVFILIPVCYIRTEKATISSEISSSLTLDVFPANLSSFHNLASTGDNGFRLSWGSSGSVTFPKLKDADGDGLMSKAFPGGNDPDDSLYDTDGDGLSDFYELSIGTNARMMDSDDDNLSDYLEILYATSPTRKDTDGDGLTDLEELNGWLYTYDFTAEGAPLETMVYSDPLMADSDLDGVTDYLERVYGFHPRVSQSSDVLDYELTMREIDSPLVMLSFNESSGAMVFTDSSNFGFSATCSAEECPLSGVDGRYAASVRFDGSDLLRLPTSAKAISLGGNQPFTLAGWVNSSGSGTLFSKWSDAPGGQQNLRLEITSSGYLQLTSSSSTVSSSSAVPAATWAHVAVTFNGSHARFFINGSAAGLSVFSVPNPPAGSIPPEIMLGAYQGASATTGHYNGSLDEFAFFDRTLSLEELDRLISARYNFNDSFVRPGEELIYQSTVTNLLNSRFAYGLLTTIIDKVNAIVDWADKLLPKTFVLYPDNPVVTGVNTEINETRLQIEPDHDVSENVTITQTVSAQIVDRRTESNLAELWLEFEEGSSASTFVDSSGNMPPRDTTCTNCPVSNQTGILNKAVRFEQGDRIDLHKLSTLKLLNRGYTYSMWIKPVSGSTIPIVQSSSNRLSINLIRQLNNRYLPEVWVNGEKKAIPSNAWRMVNPSVWSHLVVEFFTADNTLKVYVNGGQILSTTATPLTSDADLWLGGAASGTVFSIDDLRIFSRPLTVTDINRLANYPVLDLNMDNNNFSDSSVYSQPVSFPHRSNKPVLQSQSVSGTSLRPGSGSTTGFIQVSGNELLNMSDGSFTYSVWVYPTAQSSATWQGIFGRRESELDSSAYPTLERKGSQLRFGFGDGSSYQSHTTAAGILPENKWSQINITFAPNPMGSGYVFKLYLNSILKESKNFDTKPTTGSTFYVGTSSKSFTTTLGTLYMDEEHDAGSNAEPYIEEYRNDSFYHLALEEQSMSNNSSVNINHSDTLTAFESIRYEVWEEDSSSADDFCGSITHEWYDLPDSGTKSLSGGFDGRLTWSMTRPSIQFFGYIDELQVYRYAIDSEQVYDHYYAIPVTARLPLDDRPSSTSFENKALIGPYDDGVCSGASCPAAGTTGLINQAVRFDGMDDVITVPVETTSDYMVSLWLNTTCMNCGVYALQNSAGNNQHQLYLKGGNICSLAGSREMCSQGGTVANGQWHYVVYSNNGSSANLWLDGTIINTLNGLAAIPIGTSAKLGLAPNAANPTLDGQLDDVRVFRYTQDAAAIAAIQRRAPLFLAHLDEVDGSEVFDDATPNNFQLGCSGACPTSSIEGRLGSSAEFNNAALVLNQSQLSSAATGFSVSMWIYPTQTQAVTTQSIFTIPNANNSQPRYALSIAPNSMFLKVQNASGDLIPESNVELIKNTWNQVTLVVERNAGNTGENYFLYINGYLDSSGSTNVIGAGLGKIVLANASGIGSLSGGPYAGKIDEVAIYQYALNEIDVRDIFAYQMGQVEESASLTMTIDADAPHSELISYNSDFPYMDENDRVLHVEADDATSGIAMVEMQIGHINAPGEQWSVAPPCQDAPGGTAYCPTFDPQFGDGIYNLSFRAVDGVGHQSTTASYQFFVDNTAPTILADLQSGGLYKAQPHPKIENTWFLSLHGRVLDETLSDGSPGSGLDLTSVKVTIYSQNGEVTGMGTQPAALALETGGYGWNLDYKFPESEPSGALTVAVEARDLAGNLATRRIDILLDATAPNARMLSNRTPIGDTLALLDSNILDNNLLTGGTVSGEVDDEPGDDAPYITASGKLAASGVTQVETAFEPSLGSSYIFNEPYPGGLLAWLPLDDARIPEDSSGIPNENAPERYFLDISPFQFSGICTGDNCPINGEKGHRNGSIYFDGQEKFINLSSKVDLSNRSFSVFIWARRDASGYNHPFMWQGPLSMASQRFLFGIDYNNRLTCGFGGSDLLSSETYADTAWHAYACTFDFDSGRRVIYRDGQAVASDIAMPVPVMNEDLLIGYAPVGSFAGSLDELMVLDQALSAEEIREFYTGYQTVYHLTVQDNFIANGDSIADESGFFHSGTLYAGEGDANNKVTAGVVGDYALRFDGNDFLAVNSAFSLQADRGAFTQTAWIKAEGGSGLSSIIGQLDENPEQRYPTIYLTEQNGLTAGFGDLYNWNEFSSPAGVIQPGAWNFVASRFDGKTYSLFVNGQLVAQTNALEGKLPYPAGRFNIGEHFVGSIDDVKIFTRPLTNTEIMAMSRHGWRDASLDRDVLSWTAQVMPGLEGPYRVDVRGWDLFGHYSTGLKVKQQWSGVVDTLAPRLTLERTMDPDDPYLAHYSFSIEDLLLDENLIHQNLCDQIEVRREYFNSSWYLSTGIPPNTSLYRLSGTCSGDIRSRQTTGLYACDLAGNCAMEEYPAYYPNSVYLPLITGGNGAGVPSSTPVIPPQISPDDAERAMQWARLTDSESYEDGGQGPYIEIWVDELTQEDARSLFHANLRGMVSDDGVLTSVQVEILKNGAVLYTTRASVYESLWNAAWIYPPGGQPPNGNYTVRVTAVDAAGNQTKVEHDIFLNLLP